MPVYHHKTGNQAPPHAPMQQPPLMQHAQPQGYAQYPGPPSPPYASQQFDMQKPTTPPTSAGNSPTSPGYAPLPQQGYGYMPNQVI